MISEQLAFDKCVPGWNIGNCEACLPREERDLRNHNRIFWDVEILQGLQNVALRGWARMLPNYFARILGSPAYTHAHTYMHTRVQSLRNLCANMESSVVSHSLWQLCRKAVERKVLFKTILTLWVTTQLQTNFRSCFKSHGCPHYLQTLKMSRTGKLISVFCVERKLLK